MDGIFSVSFNDGQFVYFLDQFVMLCLVHALSIVLHCPNLFFFSFSEWIVPVLFTFNFEPDIVRSLPFVSLVETVTCLAKKRKRRKTLRMGLQSLCWISL